MKTNRFGAAIIVALGLPIGSKGRAAALEYRVINLGSPSAYTYATGINDAGQVVGLWQPSNYTDAFICSNGATRIVSINVATELEGINNAGCPFSWSRIV